MQQLDIVLVVVVTGVVIVVNCVVVVNVMMFVTMLLVVVDDNTVLVVNPSSIKINVDVLFCVIVFCNVIVDVCVFPISAFTVNPIPVIRTRIITIVANMPYDIGFLK